MFTLEKEEVLEARRLGMDCARDAAHAAGDRAWDQEGRSLLPEKPQEGDWEALEESHDRNITREEREAFIEGYQDSIRTLRGNHFGQYLREVRTKAGLRQKDMADVLGVTPNTIARWERAETIPHRHTEQGLVRRLREFTTQKGLDFPHRSAAVDKEPQSHITQ